MKQGTRRLPHLIILLALGWLLAAPLRATEPAPAATTPPADVQLTPPQLEQLLAPIALYPEALIALILPASTLPADVVLAARYLAAKGDPAQLDAQPWGDSVRALARYPEVVQWMDENLPWTKQVGDAFLAQPAELMSAMQRLRARARATGALVDTPQQQVVVEGDTIEIVPTQSEVIYVPRYDPEIVYVLQPPGYYYPYGSYLTFGVGFPIGLWLSYDCDWHRRVIWVGDRGHDWREHRTWRRQLPPAERSHLQNPGWRTWRPTGNRPALPPRDHQRPPTGIVRPRNFPGTPGFSPTPRHEEVRAVPRHEDARPGIRREDVRPAIRHEDVRTAPRTEGGVRPAVTPPATRPAVQPERRTESARPDHTNRVPPTAAPRAPDAPRFTPRQTPPAERPASSGRSESRASHPANPAPAAPSAANRAPSFSPPAASHNMPSTPSAPATKTREPEHRDNEH